MSTQRNNIPGKMETEEFLNIHLKKSFLYERELLRLLLEKEKKTVDYNRKEISPLDFTNLDNIPTDLAEKIVETQIKKLPNGKLFYNKERKELTKEGISYINKLINESCKYYTDTFLLPILPSYQKPSNKDKNKEIKCKTHQDIIEFIQYNNNKNNLAYNRKTHCSLLKILFCKNDLNIHQSEIEHAEENFAYIKKKIYPFFKDIKGRKVDEKDHTNENYMQLTTDLEISQNKRIAFFSSGRAKWYDRFLLKMLGNSEYTTSDAIQDEYWLKNEVKTKEDALLMIEYRRKYILKWTIKHKGILGKTTEEIQDFIESHKEKLSEDFLQEIQKIKGTSNKGKNSGDYQDIKISGKLEDKNGKNHRIETQIILVDNQNEHGYAHHKVYELMNIIEALVRLQWYAPIDLIKKYIQRTVQTNYREAKTDEENPELLYLWGLDKNKNFRKYTKEEQEKIITNTEKNIFNYLKNKQLIEITSKKQQNTTKRGIFSTLTQRSKFHSNPDNQELYPKTIITSQVSQTPPPYDTHL